MKQKSRRSEQDPRANALLRSLPGAEWALLSPRAEIITLKLGAVLFEREEPGDMVYFPLTAIVSMISLMKDGREIEYGSIGREGMVGLQVALNAQPLIGRAIRQLEGEVVRFTGEELRSIESGAGSELHRLLLRYAQATINVLAQSTACNALHSVRQRTARWLLMTRDRADNQRFDLTQEFLSKMLGVRRQGVTEAASDFQKSGTINYIRGQIQIYDNERLESEACECYSLIREEYLKVFEDH